MNRELKNKRMRRTLENDFGIIRKIPLDNTWTLKVKNDDWGEFILVSNEDHDVIYESEVIFNRKDLEKRINNLIEVFA